MFSCLPLGRLVFSSLIASGVISTAASIQSIDPFDGTLTENWESFSPSFLTGSTKGTVSILGGAGNITGSDLAIWIPGQFGPNHFGLGPFTAKTFDGSRGFGKSSSVADVSMDFAIPIIAFGGYWGISTTSDPVGLRFLDKDGSIIGETQFYYSRPNNDGTLEWHGWKITQPVSRVEFLGGQFFVNDSLRVTTVPEPSVLVFLMFVPCMALARKRSSCPTLG